MPLAGRAMVLHVLDRAMRIGGVDDVVAAIPDLAEDDRLAEAIESEGYMVSRGPSEDVLARYVVAAERSKAQVAIRLTADCPMLSPRVSGRVLDAFVDCDYASNTVVRSYPRGLDTEVLSVEALLLADSESTRPSEREHVTPFIYNHPERFTLRSLVDGVDRSGMRWTVDTPEDMAFAVSIYNELGAAFEMDNVLAFLECRPEIAGINRGIIQKPVD